MGVLVDVGSETFLFPKEHFPAAKRALDALAADAPRSFEDPKSVAAAADLTEALVAAFWQFEANEAGDLVALRYGVDKRPDSDFWPGEVLEALAPFVTSGKVVYRVDGDDRETVYTFAKGKLRARTRKATKPKAAEPAPAPYAPWIVAPPDSFGIEWRVRFPMTFEASRKRAVVSDLLDALAKTKVWRELEEVYYDEKYFAIPRQDGALPASEVARRLADGQWAIHWLASKDRETTLALYHGPNQLAFRLRVRDGALARVGSAVIDEVAQALVTYARAHRVDDPVVGHAGPFGPGSMRPADAAGPVLLGPASHAWGRVHFRANAIATLFDGRLREDQKEDATVKTIRALASASEVPGGAKRTDEDGMVVVSFSCDPTDRESIRAAASAHASWIAGFAEVAAIPSRFPAPEPIKKRSRDAADPRLEDYGLVGEFALDVDDDPVWFRDRAFVEVVLRALAKTAYWPELAEPGSAAVERAIAGVETGRHNGVVLKRGDALSISLKTSSALEIVVKAKRPVLTKLGARATRDLVAFAAEVHGALAGRGRLGKGTITIRSADWDDFVVHDHAVPLERWPPKHAIVDVFDPLATEDGHNGRVLHMVRTLAAAPVPPGAERIEAGRLVAVLFADDLGDPLVAADASARHAAWLKSVQSG